MCALNSDRSTHAKRRLEVGRLPYVMDPRKMYPSKMCSRDAQVEDHMKIATDEIFGVGEVWRQIRAAGEAGVPVAVTNRMTLDLRRLIDRAGRWLLNYRPQPLAVGAEVNRFAATVAALTPRMSEWLRGDDRAIVAIYRERHEDAEAYLKLALDAFTADSNSVHRAAIADDPADKRIRSAGSREATCRCCGRAPHRRAAASRWLQTSRRPPQQLHRHCQTHHRI